jgi:hypothetical protein
MGAETSCLVCNEDKANYEVEILQVPQLKKVCLRDIKLIFIEY